MKKKLWVAFLMGLWIFSFWDGDATAAVMLTLFSLPAIFEKKKKARGALGPRREPRKSTYNIYDI